MRKCNSCNSEVRLDRDATFWLGRDNYACDNCEKNLDVDETYDPLHPCEQCGETPTVTCKECGAVVCMNCAYILYTDERITGIFCSEDCREEFS